MQDSVCIAENRHKTWLIAEDESVDDHWIARCITLGEYLVAERNGQPVGFLRWSWFWGKIPYIDMIRVEPSFQRTGIGTLLLDHLQKSLIRQGVQMLMTSCESGEQEPLDWHLGNGFTKVGEIEFPAVQNSSEVFLAKGLD